METISQLEMNHLKPKSVLPDGEEQYEFLLTVHPKSGHMQFSDEYITLIETLGRDAHVRTKDISVASDSEHDRLIKELSPTTEVAINGNCHHKLVEDQAQRTPRFTAVDELNGTANIIAKSARGAQGDSVALSFDRGISQAGATFVPHDRDDLTLRKEFMIEECGAKVLVDLQPRAKLRRVWLQARCPHHVIPCVHLRSFRYRRFRDAIARRNSCHWSERASARRHT
ncbi:hypothetical protein HYDPIDRAFT_120478 [Hydnomerulius pinastri MD-312]|uniref:Uncharacterized protein n=1 Tax=Hydnomerulius pinastri MD-312 TaxID=994086 RepID=A0A0C9UX88_9AGAM|nr:hypothetical protein HYDPIDRAFT_120478 [Hydnomerulius pinastri MD-312]